MSDDTVSVDEEGNEITNGKAESSVNNDADPAAISDPATEALIKKMAKEIADQQLQPIKEKLDKAYKERDELATKASKAEESARQAEIKRLEEDGQELEALQLKLSDLQGRYNALVDENTSLTRDRIVSDATMALDFRNDHAKRMAIKEITEELRQGEDGTWKHTSGISIRDFVEQYAKDDEKTFLFKPKSSSGSQTMMPGQTASGEAKPDWVTSIPKSQWSGEQMFEAIKKGWLPGGTGDEQMKANIMFSS